MKIDGIKNRPIRGKSLKKKSGAVKDISFSSLLGGQVAPLQEAQATVKTEKISSPSSVSTSTRLDGISLSEKTIDTLEAFGAALENLKLSSEDLRPLVEALEGETTAILDIKEQLEVDDPLAEVLDRIAAVVYLETEKYRRGDYDQ